MDEATLLKRRVQDWIRLSELCDHADGRLRKMSGDQVLELVRLYRKASSDLSFLVTQTSNTEVIDYLNAIVVRAYGVIYRAPTRPMSEWLADGLATGARAFRRHVWAFVLSAALTFGAAFFAFNLMRARPDLREHFVSEDMEPLFEKWKEGKHDRRGNSEGIAMTALYAQNNPRVGVMVNAVSVASFGTLTSYILWKNGEMIGALAADMASVGKLPFLLTSLAPHGVSEIGGILVTASGGFVLAGALIRPGRRRRSDALRLAGKDSLAMLLSGVVMIAVAAPIEGFFSFNPAVPAWAKLVFAGASALAWTAYFVGYAPDSGNASSKDGTNPGPA